MDGKIADISPPEGYGTARSEGPAPDIEDGMYRKENGRRFTMKDLFVGRITEVLDSDRIAIEVTQVVRNHHFAYGAEEEVHIKELKTNMMGILKRVSPQLFLEPRLSGSGVMCLVGTRRASGGIEADVYILDRNVRDETGAA